MANLTILDNTSWKQPFVDRKKEFHLWNIPTKIADACSIDDNTYRHINIEFEDTHNINILDSFRITSGRKISFSTKLIDLIKPIILNEPNSFFVAKIINVTRRGKVKDPILTSKSTTINARIGQNKFRKDLINTWNGKCPLTEIDLVDILKASHIKPWAAANDKERLDKYNGILLNPTVDALFDKGFISFKDTGEIIFSNLITTSIKNKLGIQNNIIAIHTNHKPYLEYHRNKILKK
ncbi:MAG: hypothetical protein BA863_11940 [Desulfovibrio sp. S3730MH75]|nr:MAG: hypothetical protein BA863_11940 [Desulfovibrio sp. S3730MH75]